MIRLHLFDAKAVARQLIAGDLTGQEQAGYLAASFVIWLLPYYLFVVPQPAAGNASWFYMMWGYELFLMIIINVVGTFYCLHRCSVEPQRNFLIDYSCLSAPVILVNLIVGWGLYYLVTKGAIAIISRVSFTSEPPPWVSLFYSWRFFDLLRFLTGIGISVAIFMRVGSLIADIAKARSPVNSSLPPTASPASRRGPG
jgi:hypothetical protein